MWARKEKENPARPPAAASGSGAGAVPASPGSGGSDRSSALEIAKPPDTTELLKTALGALAETEQVGIATLE